MQRLQDATGSGVSNGRAAKRVVSRHPLRMEELDSRHARILQLLALDVPLSVIASELYLTPYGVKYHVDRLRAMFGVKSHAALIAAAFVAGVLASGDGTVQIMGLDQISTVLTDLE